MVVSTQGLRTSGLGTGEYYYYEYISYSLNLSNTARDRNETIGVKGRSYTGMCWRLYVVSP